MEKIFSDIGDDDDMEAEIDDGNDDDDSFGLV